MSPKVLISFRNRIIVTIGFQNITISLATLLASFILCISVSITYAGYIKKGRGSFIPFLQILALLPTIIPVTILMYVSIKSSSAIFTLIMMILFLFFIRKLSRFKCNKKEKIGKIEEIPIIICQEKRKIYNAWFDENKKEINFTRSLFEILSEEERKAVLYHEIGHYKTKPWRWMTNLLYILWFLSVSLILTMLFLLIFSDSELLLKLTLSIIFISLLPIYAISFMISSWINEHEADKYASQYVGFKTFAIALIKVHVYNHLIKYEYFIDEIKFSTTFNILDISHMQVIKEITKHIFIYLNPQTIFSQPLPQTHPPLIFRLKKIYEFLHNE